MAQRRSFVSIVEASSSLWSLISNLPPSHAMVAPLCLAGVQVAMGAFDNIYHHEIKERLPWSTTALKEQHIHSLRGGMYVMVFFALAGVEPHGYLAYGLAGTLVVECGITLWDFVTEDRTRLHRGGLIPSERITHTLMTLNYGAILACWLPVLLFDWGAQSTGIVFVNYGLPSLLSAVAATCVGAWCVRDAYSVRRLARIVAAEAATPLVLGLHPRASTVSGSGQTQTQTQTHIQTRLRILVTGGTGFLGLRLCSTLLREGHDVTLLTRDCVTAAIRLDAACRSSTDSPLRGRISFVEDISTLDPSSPLDIVINLAGEPLSASRWTSARQAKLFSSRVDLTHKLVAFLRSMPPSARPEVMVSASAIGYYGAGYAADKAASTAVGGVGDASPVEVTESSLPAETASLSHRLCLEWEATARQAESLGIRVVLPRIGVVLGRQGGALAQMLTPFEFGLGGPLGHGRQWLPWIHIDDVLRAFALMVNDRSLSGPVNAVAPVPATSQQLADTLGQVLRRPSMIPVPALALKLLLGSQLAEELLLTGQYIVPKKLLEECQAGRFQYKYPTLDEALREAALGERK